MNERSARRAAKHMYLEPQPFLGAADPYLPTSDDHDAHVQRVLAASKGGYPVLRT